MKSINKLAIVAAVLLSMTSVSALAAKDGFTPPPPRAEPFPGPKVYDANGRLVGTWFAPTGVGLTLAKGTYSLNLGSEGITGGIDPAANFIYYLNDTCSGTAYVSAWRWDSGVIGLVTSGYFVKSQKLYDINYSGLRTINPKSMKYRRDDDYCTPIESNDISVIPDGSWSQVYDLSLFRPPFSVR